MMRKRGSGGNPNNNNNNNHNRSNGNSSSAVSKLLMQNQSSSTTTTNHPTGISGSGSYRDGQTIILDIREPILAGNHGKNSSNSGGVGGDDSNQNNHSAAQLNAKNHRLAKELSEVRIRHREECKNVTRLTMENMNLASRCREAITQAANMKKDLSIQKRKTAEAVAQTHLLLDQLKKMKQQQLQMQQQQQQQKDDGSKQSQRSPQSNESPSVADEDTTVVPTNGMISIASSGLENIVNEDAIKVIVVVDENVTLATNAISSAPNSNGKYDSLQSPIASTKSSKVDDGQLPIGNVLNHGDIHVAALLSEGTTVELLEVNAVSSSPSGKAPLDVASPTSIKSSVVDLDVSYDFANDHDESYINDENHPIIVETMSDEEHGKVSTDPTPISPLDTAVEYDSDGIPNDDELNLMSSSDMISIESVVADVNSIQPTNLDDDYFQNSSTSAPQQLPHDFVNLNEPSKHDDNNTDSEIHVPNDIISKTPNEKKTVASIITTFASDEECFYDDSEHKCDDVGNDRCIMELSESMTPTTVATADPHNNFKLVSSDDYEGAIEIADHDGDVADLSGDKDIADEKFTVKLDDTRSSTVESMDDVGLNIPHPQEEASSPLLSASSALGINGNDSTDALLGHTGVVATTPFNAPIDAIPKSKDLWLEDYDEAAIQGFDDDDELSDTLSGLINTSSNNINDSLEKAAYFPHSASPKVSTKSHSAAMSENNTLEAASLPVPTTTKRYMLPPSSSLVNESYEDEFPSDIIDQRRYSSSTRFGKTKSIYEKPIDVLTEEMNDLDLSPTTASSSSLKFFGPLQERGQSKSLISSIDAFEASFQTSFPESFTPKDSPNTSPIAGAKLATSDVISTPTNDPFPSNTSLLNTVNGFDSAKSNGVAFVTEAVASCSDEGLKTRSNGIHERDAAALQRSSSRQCAQNPIDVHVEEATMLQQSTTPTSKLVPSPTHQSKSLKKVVTDQSARWLMEVRASTEKLKSNADTNIDNVTTQRESAHLQTLLDGESKSGYDTSKTALAHPSDAKSSTVKTSLAKPHQSTRSAQIDDPVFRQFPRTATPAKSFKHVSSHSSRINFSDETLSASTSDKEPLLQGRVSDEYSISQATSPQQKISGDSDTSLRSRYVSVLGQASSSFTSDRGRLSISRRSVPNENSHGASTSKGASSLTPATKDTTVHGMTKSRSLAVNVRERAAIYSKVSSPTVGASPNNGKSHANNIADSTPYYSRGASRSTVQILEDEGEIPMQTSLSPRKFRNGDNSHRSTMGQTSRIGSDEKEVVGVTNAVENVTKNYQRLTESANAKVLDHHEKRTTHIDVGKQRRHINLSGRGRLSRKIDHENDTAHINENGY